MRLSCYLLIGADGSVQVRRQRPKQSSIHQVAIRLNIQLDDAWFKRSIPVVELTVPDAAVLPVPTVTPVDSGDGEEHP